MSPALRSWFVSRCVVAAALHRDPESVLSSPAFFQIVSIQGSAPA
jgi:hypothetical protein